MIDHLKGIQSYRAEQDKTAWEKMMKNLKNIAIGAGIVACWLLASDNDYRIALAEFQEKEARIAAACKRMGKEAARDNDKKLVCMDSAPAIALARPVK